MISEQLGGILKANKLDLSKLNKKNDTKVTQ
jgi:hypothetical protein